MKKTKEEEIWDFFGVLPEKDSKSKLTNRRNHALLQIASDKLRGMKKDDGVTPLWSEEALRYADKLTGIINDKHAYSLKIHARDAV